MNLPILDFGLGILDSAGGRGGRFTADAQSAQRFNQSSGSEPDFASALRASVGSNSDPLRTAATELVATAFIAPVLASRHESVLAPSQPFAPGAAEKRFMPLLDQQLADRVAQATGLSLVDAIVQRYGGRR